MIYTEEKEQLKELGLSEEMMASLEKCSAHRSNSGLEFHQRETGMHFLFDEVTSRFVSDAPRYLSIALTTECNLSCPFCYVDKSKKRMLDSSLVKGIVSEAANKGTLAVSFGGGEPSLYPYLEDVLRFTHEKTSLAVGMTSNCTEELVKLTPSISRYVDFLRISMDGIRDTYYSHRGIPFEDFVKRFVYLLGYYKIGINYLVDETTIDDLDEAFSMMKDWGVRELLLLPREPDCHESVMSRLYEWIRRNKDEGILMEISSARKGKLPFLAPYREDDDSLDYAHIDAKGVMKRSSFEYGGLSLLPYCNISTDHGETPIRVKAAAFSDYHVKLNMDPEYPGLIEMEGKFTSEEKLRRFELDFNDISNLSIEYEGQMLAKKHTGIKIPNRDPYVLNDMYFLAYGRPHTICRVNDTTVRITTKSDLYPAFIYELVQHGALVSIRYIDKGERQMKIWYGYSSEHSSCMTIIAEFKSEEDMMEAERAIINNRHEMKFRSSERKALFSDFADCFWEAGDYDVGRGKNNKLLISTDAYGYTNAVELLLSQGAEVKIAGEDYPIEETELNIPDLRECAERMYYWFDDMDDDPDE